MQHTPETLHTVGSNSTPSVSDFDAILSVKQKVDGKSHKTFQSSSGGDTKQIAPSASQPSDKNLEGILEVSGKKSTG